LKKGYNINYIANSLQLKGDF